MCSFRAITRMCCQQSKSKNLKKKKRERPHATLPFITIVFLDLPQHNSAEPRPKPVAVKIHPDKQSKARCGRLGTRIRPNMHASKCTTSHGQDCRIFSPREPETRSQWLISDARKPTRLHYAAWKWRLFLKMQHYLITLTDRIAQRNRCSNSCTVYRTRLAPKLKEDTVCRKVWIKLKH